MSSSSSDSSEIPSSPNSSRTDVQSDDIDYTQVLEQDPPESDEPINVTIVGFPGQVNDDLPHGWDIESHGWPTGFAWNKETHIPYLRETDESELQKGTGDSEGYLVDPDTHKIMETYKDVRVIFESKDFITQCNALHVNTGADEEPDMNLIPAGNRGYIMHTWREAGSQPAKKTIELYTIDTILKAYIYARDGRDPRHRCPVTVAPEDKDAWEALRQERMPIDEKIFNAIKNHKFSAVRKLCPQMDQTVLAQSAHMFLTHAIQVTEKEPKYSQRDMIRVVTECVTKSLCQERGIHIIEKAVDTLFKQERTWALRDTMKLVPDAHRRVEDMVKGSPIQAFMDAAKRIVREIGHELRISELFSFLRIAARYSAIVLSCPQDNDWSNDLDKFLEHNHDIEDFLKRDDNVKKLLDLTAARYEKERTEEARQWFSLCNMKWDNFMNMPHDFPFLFLMWEKLYHRYDCVRSTLLNVCQSNDKFELTYGPILPLQVFADLYSKALNPLTENQIFVASAIVGYKGLPLRALCSHEITSSDLWRHPIFAKDILHRLSNSDTAEFGMYINLDTTEFGMYNLDTTEFGMYASTLGWSTLIPLCFQTDATFIGYTHRWVLGEGKDFVAECTKYLEEHPEQGVDVFVGGVYHIYGSHEKLSKILMKRVSKALFKDVINFRIETSLPIFRLWVEHALDVDYIDDSAVKEMSKKHIAILFDHVFDTTRCELDESMQIYQKFTHRLKDIDFSLLRCISHQALGHFMSLDPEFLHLRVLVDKLPEFIQSNSLETFEFLGSNDWNVEAEVPLFEEFERNCRTHKIIPHLEGDIVTHYKKLRALTKGLSARTLVCIFTWNLWLTRPGETQESKMTIWEELGLKDGYWEQLSPEHYVKTYKRCQEMEEYPTLILDEVFLWNMLCSAPLEVVEGLFEHGLFDELGAIPEEFGEYLYTLTSENVTVPLRKLFLRWKLESGTDKVSLAEINGAYHGNDEEYIDDTDGMMVCLSTAREISTLIPVVSSFQYAVEQVHSHIPSDIDFNGLLKAIFTHDVTFDHVNFIKNTVSLYKTPDASTITKLSYAIEAVDDILCLLHKKPEQNACLKPVMSIISKLLAARFRDPHASTRKIKNALFDLRVRLTGMYDKDSILRYGHDVLCEALRSDMGCSVFGFWMLDSMTRETYTGEQRQELLEYCHPRSRDVLFRHEAFTREDYKVWVYTGVKNKFPFLNTDTMTYSRSLTNLPYKLDIEKDDRELLVPLFTNYDTPTIIGLCKKSLTLYQYLVQKDPNFGCGSDALGVLNEHNVEQTYNSDFMALLIARASAVQDTPLFRWFVHIPWIRKKIEAAHLHLAKRSRQTEKHLRCYECFEDVLRDETEEPLHKRVYVNICTYQDASFERYEEFDVNRSEQDMVRRVFKGIFPPRGHYAAHERVFRLVFKNLSSNIYEDLADVFDVPRTWPIVFNNDPPHDFYGGYSTDRFNAKVTGYIYRILHASKKLPIATDAWKRLWLATFEMITLHALHSGLETYMRSHLKNLWAKIKSDNDLSDSAQTEGIRQLGNVLYDLYGIQTRSTRKRPRSEIGDIPEERPRHRIVLSASFASFTDE